MPAISIGMAVSVFGAQAIGAGRQESLHKVINAGVVLNFTIGGVLIALSYLFAKKLEPSL